MSNSPCHEPTPRPNFGEKKLWIVATALTPQCRKVCWCFVGQNTLMLHFKKLWSQSDKRSKNSLITKIWPQPITDLLKDGSNTELEGSGGQFRKLSLKIGHRIFKLQSAHFDKWSKLCIYESLSFLNFLEFCREVSQFVKLVSRAKGD